MFPIFLNILLIEKEAKRLGVKIDEKEVEDKVNSELEMMKKNLGDDLEDRLKSQGYYSIESYLDIVRIFKRLEITSEKTVKAWQLHRSGL